MPSKFKEPKEGTQYRTVVPSVEMLKYAKGKKGAQRIYGYCIADYGILFDRGDEWIRLAIRNKLFDPTQLKDVVRFAREHHLSFKKNRVDSP